MGSRPVTSPTYNHLTMENYENLKLTSALGNAPQKNSSPKFLGFDKDTPLSAALITQLSTPSSFSTPLLLIFQTPTPTPISTAVFSSSITILGPYIPPKSKTTHQLSTLSSFSSITQTVSSSSHLHQRPSIATNHLPLSSLFGLC